MSNYQNFTSLPPEKEREFVVYEKTSVESGQRAWRIALITALSFGILVVGIVIGIGAKPKNKMADDDLGMLKRAEKDKDKAKAKAEKAATMPDKPEADSSGTAEDKPDEAGDDKAEGDNADGDKAEGDSADGDKAEGE